MYIPEPDHGPPPDSKTVQAFRIARTVAACVLAAAFTLTGWVPASAAPQGNTAAIARIVDTVEPPNRLQRTDPDALQAIKFSRRALTRLRSGDRFVLPLPGGVGARLRVVARHGHRKRGFSLTVQLAGGDEMYRGVLSVGPRGIMGRLRTPTGLMRIVSDADMNWVVDQGRSGWHAERRIDRFVPRPPRAEAATSVAIDDGSRSRSEMMPPTAEDQSGPAVVDLLILYTPGMQARYPGSQLETRLQFLVTLGNQALADSDVGLRLRLIHSAQVSYPESGTNSIALDDITFGRGSLGNIGSLRSQYGADLVTLIRPYDRATHGSCGIAWLLGTGGRIPTSEAPYAYSVVSDGDDDATFFFCSDLALIHELGHNMGNAHDRANAGGPGVLPYSYGYGVSGAFGTIMSYISPELARFSDPRRACQGLPCGISQNQPNSADNVLSMNTVRTDLAALLPESANAPPPDSDFDGLPDTYEDARASLDSTEPDDASGDQDNDGRTALSEYRSGSDPEVPEPEATVAAHQTATGRFEIRRLNQATSTSSAFLFGQTGWQAVVGNWNRDGRDSVGLYNPLTSRFFLKFTNAAGGGADVVFRFGKAGWTAIAGDWDGDGRDTLGLYNPASSRFFLRNSNTSGPHDITFRYGKAGWVPLAGDWDGDGIDSIGLFNPANARFFLRNTSSTGPTDRTFVYGVKNWRPVVGDWNSDGIDTIGVYNPSTGRYFLRNKNSAGPTELTFIHGKPDSTPLGGVWRLP